MFDRSLFETARDRVAVEALAVAETDLRRAGSEQRGQCPLCGAGAKKSASAPFAVNPAKRTWRCYVCDLHGDVIDLEQALRGGTPVEAARRLVGDAPRLERTNRPARPARPEGPSAADRVAAETLREARPLIGSPAARYLLGRRIGAEVIAAAAPSLRYHPNAKWSWDDAGGRWTRAPALVTPLEAASAAAPAGVFSPVPTGGIHCTYLTRDGSAKAALDPAKRMWGAQRSAEGALAGGRLAGGWLIPPAAATDRGVLIVGEGVETVLSVATLHHRRTGLIPAAVAALSLDRLQGGLLRDAEGRIDPYAPQPDPERPGFTWPGPWDQVLIAVDRDMGDLKIKARTPRGRTCTFTLDAEARARLCGRLAAVAWKAAGAGNVRAIAPSPGCDFNDDLRRILALEKSNR